MPELTTAEYRELATSASNFVEDLRASAEIVISETATNAAMDTRAQIAGEIEKAEREAARLNTVADLRELADLVESDAIEGVALAYTDEDGAKTAYYPLDGAGAKLCAAVAVLNHRMITELSASAG